MELQIEKPNIDLVGIAYIELSDPYNTNGYFLNFKGCDTTQSIIWDTTLNISKIYPFKFFIYITRDTQASCAYPTALLVVDSVILSHPTSVIGTENAIDDIRMFPNPSNGFVSISMPNTHYPSQLELFDSHGKMIATKVLTSNTTLDYTALPKGVYFLRFKGKYSTHLKLVMQ